MLVENYSYQAAFIVTAGIAVSGILGAYKFFQKGRDPVFQLLVYQQIFLFSAFITGIWGNLALREIVADFYMNAELTRKIAFYGPLPGIPFLVVSWFMLLKFGFNINGYVASKKWGGFFFGGFLIILASIALLWQEVSSRPLPDPDLFFIRAFVATNLFFHLVFLYPILKPKEKRSGPLNKKTLRKCLILYFPGVVLYSGMLWLLDYFGFILTIISFLFLFGAGALLPFCLTGDSDCPEASFQKSSGDPFLDFCNRYGISPRERDIIAEICQGKTNHAIAEALFISLQTVKDHTHRIYSKTAVKNRIQLANLVREQTAGDFRANQ